MQMATQQLFNMGIINPKDTPTFFANKNHQHQFFNIKNNVITTKIHTTILHNQQQKNHFKI